MTVRLMIGYEISDGSAPASIDVVWEDAPPGADEILRVISGVAGIVRDRHVAYETREQSGPTGRRYVDGPPEDAAEKDDRFTAAEDMNLGDMAGVMIEAGPRRSQVRKTYAGPQWLFVAPAAQTILKGEKLIYGAMPEGDPKHVWKVAD